MRVLLRTYLDIIALRKGPEVIPASWIIFAVSLGMLAAFWALQIALIEQLVLRQVFAALIAYALALAFYGTIVVMCGFTDRLLPALSAIVACGSAISAVALLVAQLLAPFVGRDVATDLSLLLWFWSIPVKGHIVARTIRQHWFVGIAIAMSAFVLRLGVEAAFVPA